jgi:hypothetical protein
MAQRGRPKSQNAGVSGNASIDANPDAMSLLNDIRKQLEDSKKRIEELEKQKNVAPSSTDKSDDAITDDFDRYDIRQDDYIKVVSLTPYELNLSTDGRGTKIGLFTFRYFGDSKRILYSDLNKILNNYKHFLDDGLFYIADNRVIRRHGYNDLYSRILDQKTIEKIVDGGLPIEDVASVYKSASQSQQIIVIRLLMDKMNRGEEVDYNLIDKLSRISGVKIQEKYEEEKAYLNILEDEDKEEK